MKKNFYAVVYETGGFRTFNNWPETEAYSKGKRGVKVKGFEEYRQAKAWAEKQGKKAISLKAAKEKLKAERDIADTLEKASRDLQRYSYPMPAPSELWG